MRVTTSEAESRGVRHSQAEGAQRGEAERSRTRQGLVLVAVLFFVLLAGSAVATLVRRATVDGLGARNRDLAGRCEALARGGVQLATALVLQDRVDEEAAGFRIDDGRDLWARASALPVTLENGDELRLRIEDPGQRLNLNALFEDGTLRDPLSELLLAALFEKVVSELPRSDDKEPYDPEELARSLMDWIDADDTSPTGALEDDWYQQQDPPYRAANRALLSFDELRLVRGFDDELVEALRPYVSVHPWTKADGINPNTAPPWVLALLFHGTPGDFRLADEDTVRAVLDIRDAGGTLCADEVNQEGCTPIRDAVLGEIYPPPTYSAEVFRVTAEGRCGEVVRSVEAVVDRSDPTKPALVAWSVR
jgi:general secretion pathway protein K